MLSMEVFEYERRDCLGEVGSGRGGDRDGSPYCSPYWYGWSIS